MPSMSPRPSGAPFAGEHADQLRLAPLVARPLRASAGSSAASRADRPRRAPRRCTKPTASPRAKRPWRRRARPARRRRCARARAPRSIACAFSSTERSGDSATAAASPACWLVVGATSTCLSESSRGVLGGHDHVRAVRQHARPPRRAPRGSPRAGRRSRGSASGRRRSSARRARGTSRASPSPLTTATAPQRAVLARRPPSRASRRLAAVARQCGARRAAPQASRASRSLDLQAHVGDVEARDLAVVGEHGRRELGLVGVQMHLQRARVADHQHRVAELPPAAR